MQRILQPSDSRFTIEVVFRALLICSDDDCTETFEAWGTLEELQALACDCGCGLELISLDESAEADPRLTLVPLR